MSHNHLLAENNDALFSFFFKENMKQVEFQLVGSRSNRCQRKLLFFCISDQIKFEYRYSSSGCSGRIHKCSGKMGVAA